MRLTRSVSQSLVAIAILGLSLEARAEQKWTEWISEETPAALCDGNFGASGIAVRGKFSDDISLLCESHPDLVIDYSVSFWTQWLSEETPGNLLCPLENFVVTGVQCSGRYCDNIRFECSKVLAPYFLRDRSYESYVSTASGEPTSFAGSGLFLTAMGCSSRGRFCERMMFQYRASSR